MEILNLSSNLIATVDAAIGMCSRSNPKPQTPNPKPVPKKGAQTLVVAAAMAHARRARNLVEGLVTCCLTRNRLTDLDLSRNELSGLPSTLILLTNLTLLKIPENKTIAKFPDEFFERVLKLTLLDAEDNRLTEVPTEIKNLTQLTHLDLGRNRITILPKEIGELEKLRILKIHHNQVSIPPWSRVEGKS